MDASLLPTEAEALDLDARILHAEQRLVAREARLQRHVTHMGARVRLAWQPRRLLLPLGSALLALLSFKGLRRGHAPAPVRHVPAAPPREGGAHWLAMVGLVWPLLPRSWRARVPPQVVNLTMSVGLPLLETVMQLRAPPPLTTASPVDPGLLVGEWYEIARLPAGRHGAGHGQPLWQHDFDADGTLLMHEQRRAADGTLATTHTTMATVLPDSGCARWRATDWPWPLQLLPGTWHELAVLHVDPAGTELVVGSPSRDRLRLLSRSPGLAPARLQALLALTLERGYDLDRLQFVDHL